MSLRRGQTVVALGALLVSLVIAAAALGSAAPRTGSYRVTHGFKFKFSIRPGVCRAAPKNLTNPKAGAGKKAKGLCFTSGDQPPIKVTCPPPTTAGGDVMSISLFSGLRLVGGKIHVKAYSYTSGPKPVGFYEFSIAVSGAKASGFVRKTSTVFDANGAPVKCDSGKLPFAAAHT